MSVGPTAPDRLLLTGWGLVAQALAQEARARGGEVLILSRGVSDGEGFRRVDLMLDDEATIAGAVRCFAPTLVVHTAALTSVAACERDARSAYLVNVVATRRVVEAASAAGAPLVALSTDWVFDGERGGYREDDPVAPRNVYGMTKAWAEEVVLEAGGTAVRGTYLGHRPDGRAGLVERLLDPGATPAVPRGKRASPLWVGHAAAAILDLAAAGARGLVHVGSSDAVGWRSLAEAIRGGVGEVVEVEPADGVSRPRDTSLAVAKAEALLRRRFPSVRESLAAMLAAQRPAMAGRS